MSKSPTEEKRGTRGRLILPYEMDAGSFVYEQVKALCGDSPELLRLYQGWMPENEEHKALFRRIEAKLMQNI